MGVLRGRLHWVCSLLVRVGIDVGGEGNEGRCGVF